MIRPLTAEAGAWGTYWAMVGGGAGMSLSPAEISFLESRIRTVAGSPLCVTRAVDLPDRNVGAAETADVGHVARSDVHPVLFRGDDARGLIKAAFLDEERLRQERLDRLERNCGYCVPGERFAVDAGRELHRTGGGTSSAAVLSQAQLRRRHAPIEDQHVAGRN